MRDEMRGSREFERRRRGIEISLFFFFGGVLWCSLCCWGFSLVDGHQGLATAIDDEVGPVGEASVE